MAARPMAVLLGDIEANNGGIGEVLLEVEDKNEGGVIEDMVDAAASPSIIDVVGLVVVGT